ncbi:LamG domain-containing protein [Simiduia agarivorans]|uniref:ATPase n=1 Tax=Simiduia agarivorans (strain DSM 21679 / JCM 13881 / BCRC 17597 / SA1) TaxID=1117647 RepID=K4KMZ8_SIMAS|nr:LamG domain-containing protein [Simiduia agarivorans]AFU99595.1 ATPase [Simiduia agarivorans SA1 = DSM 21679]
MTTTITLLGRVLLPVSLAAIVACGGGSGAQTIENNNPNQGNNGGGGFTYTGPAPATDDVQSFKINVWDNLVADDRCGACHIDGGQSPQFVRRDDVNEAYAIANTLVDLSNPAASRLVTKVGGGHNCWETEASACADTMTTWITRWAQASGSISNTVVLTAPELKDVGASKSFPATPDGFQPVYDLLQPYCGQCHSSTSANQQQPYLGEGDIQVAYDAARSRISLDTPENSRLVVRLRNEFHNCWGNNCPSASNEMEAAIRAFADSIEPVEVDPALVISKAVNLADDGIVASSGGRVENNVIALYQFKTGSGSTAFDTSGVSPALHLTLSGPHEWLGAWGVKFNGGKAQGSTQASRKLYDLLTATNEFSIEAWVVPENTTQDGPARIITYSGGDTARNFTVGQTLYNYDFALRSSTGNDANGMPLLSTPNADEVLQATLQHVVMTYSPVNGRRIYVNGELSSDADELEPGLLANWDPSFALALGAEVSNGDAWLGAVRLLAIHNRTLSDTDIVTNYDAGVGEKFFLLFSVSHLVDMPDAFVVFEVQQFDNYGYLFNKPFFISLDNTAAPSAPFTLSGMRIGVNGREASVGQAYANLNVEISSGNYVEGGVVLSELGTIIPLDKGPTSDQFFLTFDQAGSNTFARTEPVPTPPATPADIEGQTAIGLRHYEEINNTLAALTGVSKTDPAVNAVFELVKQQMPTEENPRGFLAAHQMGITQLAVQYCNELVDSTSMRASYFPGFNFSANVNSAFDATGRSQIIDPLVAAMLGHSFATVPNTGNAVMDDQPIDGEIQTELNSLIDAMTATSCSSDCVTKTANTVKAVCAAATGSAVMLLQ